MKKFAVALGVIVAGAVPSASSASLVTYSIPAHLNSIPSTTGPYQSEIMSALGLFPYSFNKFSFTAVLDTTKVAAPTGFFALESFVLTVNGTKTINFGTAGSIFRYDSLGEGFFIGASDQYDTAPSLAGLESRSFSIAFRGLAPGTIYNPDFFTRDPFTFANQVEASLSSAAQGGAVPSHSNASAQGSTFGYGPFLISSSVLVGEAAVPEPATWMLMVGGFGLIGGAMRRRDDRRKSLV
jgi:hypothetical protein